MKEFSFSRTAWVCVGLGSRANHIGLGGIGDEPTPRTAGPPGGSAGFGLGKGLRMVARVHGLEDEAGEGVRFAIAKHGGGDGFHLPHLAGLGVELQHNGHGFAVLLDLGGDDLEAPGHVWHKHFAGKNLAIRGLHIFGENFSGFHGDGGRGEAGQDLDGWAWAFLRGGVESQREGQSGE